MIDLLREFAAVIPSSFLALVTVINPLGTGLLLGSMTEGAKSESKKQLAKKIVFNCLLIFLVVLLAGKYILLFFGISLPIIRISGGLLLAYMGWNMLNANDTPKDAEDASAAEDHSTKSLSALLNNAFYPYTFPVTCGPGCIAVLFTLSAHHSNSQKIDDLFANLLGTMVGLTGVAVLVYFCYIYSGKLEKTIGASGARALNRMMAFITLCIGVQILWAGIMGLEPKL